MSLPTNRQAYAFLKPLRARSTIFVVKNRETNLKLSCFILGCLAVSKTRTEILDTSLFYSVNVRRLTEALPKEFVQQTVLSRLTDDVVYEGTLARLMGMDASALIIDDLNAVLQVLSSQSQKSGIHRLATFYDILSYNARINRLFALGVVYKTELTTSSLKTTKRSLPNISDLQVAVEVGADEIVFRCSQIAAWPNEGFRVPIYLEPRT